MFAFVILAGIMAGMQSCSESREHRMALQCAVSVMNDFPDSALHILDSLKEHEQHFGRHFRMQCSLHHTNALNKLDTLFRTTDGTQQLADYFDDHGTPNEKMLAHYLLGRAYYDTGESPMALKCFQDAVAMADTTAKDCDYWQLSRVYGQMGNIFWQQNLLQHDLECTDKAIKYAYTAGDTVNALLNMADKIHIYDQWHKSDSAIFLCEKLSMLFRKYGHPDIAASMLGTSIKLLLNKGDITKAKHYIDIYDTESGFFDAKGNIEHGREVYYYYKSQYYLTVNQYDSAEYYFRKELRDGKDFNNQNAGARGLALLFQQTNRPDSAAKYALYSYEMNDSVYAHMATREVANVHGLYNYIHNQEIAQKEKEKNVAERNKVRWLAGFLLIMMLAGIYYVRNTRQKRREMSRKYHKSVTDIAYLQSEVTKLTSQKSDLDKLLANEKSKYLASAQISEDNALALKQAESGMDLLHHNIEELHRMITEKESIIIKLKTDLQVKYKQEKHEIDLANENLKRHKFYPTLHELSSKGQAPDDSQWQELKTMAAEIYPGFYEFISSKNLNEKEFYTCMLLRMFVKPKAIANMLGVTQSYISKIRSEMLFRFFNVTGTSREFDKKIMEIV
ncbi:MAG: hypothetical protein Q4F85_09295 [Prevotella sp.]|nr:hypothetical protein [Prevotella sp.]